MMTNPKVKIGDTVRMLLDCGSRSFKQGAIIRVERFDTLFSDGTFYGVDSVGRELYIDGLADRFEFADNKNLENIMNIIDESVWYGDVTPYPKSKPSQALGALIKVLVDKGLVTEGDFRNALLTNSNNTGKESVGADASPNKE